MRNILKKFLVVFGSTIFVGFFLLVPLQVNASAELTTSQEKIFVEVAPSVVPIEMYRSVHLFKVEYVFHDGGFELVRTPNGTRESKAASGTAFFIKSSGYLVTNKHVVMDKDATYKIRYNERLIPARVIYRDPKNDIAIVKVAGRNYPTVTLGNSAQIKIGQSVIGIGNALGDHEDSVSSGIITALNQRLIVRDDGSEMKGLIETNAEVYPGDSGGPLLNSVGKVIGINTATTLTINEDSPSGFSLPINLVKYTLRKARITLVN